MPKEGPVDVCSSRMLDAQCANAVSLTEVTLTMRKRASCVRTPEIRAIRGNPGRLTEMSLCTSAVDLLC